MAEITTSYETRSKERGIMNVHLFNCDRTFKFDSIRKLLQDVEELSKYRFTVEEHYFPLPKMAETCTQIADYKMDFAVFVVHANESRLSLNEERAGIGYAKIYRALLRHTDNRVLIVIGGDDNYKSEENSQVLSRWAKIKISSQFPPEYLDGRKSFIFSWEKQHHYIHKDALMHFLDATKQGHVFVPKQRPLPADSGLKDGTKEQPQAQASEAQASQRQATQGQATHSNLFYQSADPLTHTTAKREREKPSPVIDPLLTKVTKPDHLSKEKPRSHSNSFPSDACAVRPDVQGHPNQTYNAEQRHKPTTQAYKPSVQPSAIHPGASVKGTKERPPAPQGSYQQPTVEKRKEKVPPTPVHVAIINCYVSGQSVQVAHMFFYEVAKRLNLQPSFTTIVGHDPSELVIKLNEAVECSSLNFVVLLVEKKVLEEISAGRQNISSYTDLLEETEANAGSQAILIVCNDQERIPGDVLQSQSVTDFLGHVGQVKGVTLNPDRWVTLSWNEHDPTFTTRNYETYLVRLVEIAQAREEEDRRARGAVPGDRRGVPRDRQAVSGDRRAVPGDGRAVPGDRRAVSEDAQAAPARNQPYLTTTGQLGLYTPPPANQSGSHMGHGQSVSSSVPPAAAQAASSGNPIEKGDILLEGTLEYGRVKSETYKRSGWQPTHSVYGQLYRDNANKPYSEFQVVQDADGSISILTDSAIVGFGKGLWKSAKAHFSKPKGDSQGSYYC